MPGLPLAHIAALAFSPDGRILALAGSGKVWLRDARSGREVQLEAAHKGGVGDLAFSPDGKTLAAGGYQVVKFWDVEAALNP
jgi:WD40 repeat protein